MRTILTLLLLTVVAGCQQRSGVVADREPRRTISLPALGLGDGERISGIELELTGGRFDAVNVIPHDFFAEVEPPLSGRSRLRLQANHGAVWLPARAVPNEFATITIQDEQRFALSGTVEISSRDSERRISLRQEDLVLREAERQ